MHGSSHYDALGHVWHGGKIWNGYDARTTVGGMRRASVLPIAEKGVVGRGILLDMAHYRGKAALEKGLFAVFSGLLSVRSCRWGWGW